MHPNSHGFLHPVLEAIFSLERSLFKKGNVLNIKIFLLSFYKILLFQMYKAQTYNTKNSSLNVVF